MFSKLRLASFAVSLMLGSIVGCSRSTPAPVQVNLPSGYRGQVTLRCTASKGFPAIVQVSADGSVNTNCSAETRLDVRRDGQPVEIENGPKWLKTGDGIVTGVNFTVK